MLYDGVLGFDYNTIVNETECYVDAARHIVVMKAEEAVGMVDSDSVTIIYDVVDNKPIVIAERCSVGEVNLKQVQSRVNYFNGSDNNYFGVVSVNGDWIDITVTRTSVYEIVNNTM